MSLKINHIKRTVIAAAIILAVVFLAVLPAVTIYIYEDYFGFKSTPVSWRTLYTDDFAGYSYRIVMAVYFKTKRNGCP